MEKKDRISSPAVGGSSLLVIFAVLCLTVFALLSLSTVQAERRMANASVRAVSAYYEADYQAELIFARLRSGKSVQGVQQNGERYTYVCPISDNQKLVVELQNDDGQWTVLRWQAVAEPGAAEDDSPDVWDGES